MNSEVGMRKSECGIRNCRAERRELEVVDYSSGIDEWMNGGYDRKVYTISESDITGR